MKALTSSAGFRSEAQVCTWVQRICVNSCYDQLRRRKSADRRDQAPRQASLWRDPGYTVNPEEVPLAAADADLLREAMARLSPDQSRAVVLHDVEGWTAARLPAPSRSACRSSNHTSAAADRRWSRCSWDRSREGAHLSRGPRPGFGPLGRLTPGVLSR